MGSEHKAEKMHTLSISRWFLSRPKLSWVKTSFLLESWELIAYQKLSWKMRITELSHAHPLAEPLKISMCSVSVAAAQLFLFWGLLWEDFFFFAFIFRWGFQMVKNLPAVRETWVRSLGPEDPLEKEIATHSSILAWRFSQRRATVHGVAKCWTQLSD